MTADRKQKLVTGAGTERRGLHPHHAQLAANSAITWCQLVLDTLADAKAP